jgi:thiamine biosynthesis lipoprotein
MKRNIYIVTLGIFLSLICNYNQLFAQSQRYTFSKGLMGSPFKLVFYAPNDSIAVLASDAAFKRIEKLNEHLSDYLDGSEINKLSVTSGTHTWVEVSDELLDVVSISKEISTKTKGYFDITVGPVVQMWRKSLRKRAFPSSKEIRVAKRGVGYTAVKINSENRKIMLSKKRMRLDVGGIGKGYAADEAIKVLKTFDIHVAMVDAGGDLALSDAPPGRKGWSISISSGQDSVRTVELANVGIATSGATYRFIEHKGKKYSHIVNPYTGIGLQHHIQSTVIAPNGTLADALATAISVAGIEKSKQLLHTFPGVKVLLKESKNEQEKFLNTIDFE